MKNIAIALAVLIAFAAPVKAADMFTPDTADYEAPVYAFTGFALGIDGGGQFTAIQLNDPDGPFEFDGIASDGLIGGGHIEYLFAVDRFRLGAYGEGGFSNVNTTINGTDLQTMDHYYGIGLKAGVTVYGGTLLYMRGGYDWSQWSSEIPGEDEKADVGAWLIGGGIETMVADHWSIGLGGDYLIVDDVEFDGADETAYVEDSETLRIKARLTRRW